MANLDVAQRSLTLDKGLTRDEHGAPVPGKSGSRKARPRVVTVTGWVADLFQHHVETLSDADAHSWIFKDSRGGPIRYSNWRRRVWDVRRFNIPKLIANGVDVRTVMNRIGHTSPQVTLALYAQADRAAYEEPARTIGDLMMDEMSHVERTGAADSQGL